MAHYLLSRFSFVAQPTTNADDVGSDFYCTIFDILDSDPPMVEPRTSFAIQVKSNAQKIEVHNKVQYFHHLEIPFFIGVVDQAAAVLKIYSAEWLPMMFATFGIPEKLWLRPNDNIDYERPWEGENAQTGVTLDCYPVCTFSAAEGRDELRPKVAKLLNLCRRATANIGSRRAEEHIYHWPQGAISIVAGPGSAQHFRNNLYKRLAEAFFNFKWILEAEPDRFSLAEFKTYETFYIALTRLELPPMLALANTPYVQARRLVDQLTSEQFPP